MRPALFLDRDGTLNVDVGYVKNPEDVVLLPGVAESLRLLRDKFNFLFIVVSNQSGIARGLLQETDVLQVNARLDSLLKESANISIDRYYWCKHHPDYGDVNDCDCRKPAPGMLLSAAEEFDIDLSHSFMIGDKISDAEAGYNAGVRSILLVPSDFSGEKDFSLLQNPDLFPNFVAYNFSEVCDLVIQNF